MGDLHSWPAHSDGNLSSDSAPPPSLLQQSCPPNPDPSSIDAAAWQHAEKAAQEVIQQVHPTVLSERRRREVVGFVQRVIKQFTGAEVCALGSVPLKTYLPDGDIDLTAIGAGPAFEENLPGEVRNVLHSFNFQVKDVHLIHAEVKLVKCLVQNIIVDISFNQIGGLYTLCFLEQVDQLIGKDHLFKRSIMLIKSWCYYESRILGAHHGLISTYALETLVLYIFHVFHKTLDAPLAVLYRFLDYYSKFDWENYGVSLWGRISLASLPDIISEKPETAREELLIQEEFVSQCVERFQVPLRPTENRVFTRKNLNIVDPLKISNNLGRSVSKSNFYRIRSAFVFGARKLGRILSAEVGGDVTADVSAFFRNTLERHGSGAGRPDIAPPVDPVNELLEEEPSIYHPPHMFFLNHHSTHNSDCINTNNNDNNNESKNNKNMAELSGEMEANIRSLLYAQECHNYSVAASYMQPVPIIRGKPAPHPVHPAPGAPYTGFRRGAPVYGVFVPPPPPGPAAYYVVNGVLTPAGGPGVGGFGGEESPKPRGTGTYFPMQNYRPQQNYREASPRSKNPPLTIRPVNTARSADQSNPTNSDESWNSVPDSPANPAAPPVPQSPNGSRRYGGVVLPPVSPSGTRPALGPQQRKMRNSQVYQLKDEGDFPPLSG